MGKYLARADVPCLMLSEDGTPQLLALVFGALDGRSRCSNSFAEADRGAFTVNLAHCVHGERVTGPSMLLMLLVSEKFLCMRSPMCVKLLWKT